MKRVGGWRIGGFRDRTFKTLGEMVFLNLMLCFFSKSVSFALFDGLGKYCFIWEVFSRDKPFQMVTSFDGQCKNV